MPYYKWNTVSSSPHFSSFFISVCAFVIVGCIYAVPYYFNYFDFVQIKAWFNGEKGSPIMLILTCVVIGAVLGFSLLVGSPAGVMIYSSSF